MTNMDSSLVKQYPEAPLIVAMAAGCLMFGKILRVSAPLDRTSETTPTSY